MEPRPEGQVRGDELSVVPMIELQLSSGFRPVVIERWLRLCGESMRWIAETETDWRPDWPPWSAWSPGDAGDSPLK